QVRPSGFNDGIGLEDRYYVSPMYADLGTAAYDTARSPFLSVGYYPAKSMVDARGIQFRPGPFARFYLTYGPRGTRWYLFADAQFIATPSLRPTLCRGDAGVAVRPFSAIPRLEFRLGTQDTIDLHDRDRETSIYGSIRCIY